MVMYKGVKVHNPGRPREMRDGGYVVPGKNMSKSQLSRDSVLAILQPGEVVLPVRHYQKAKKKWVNVAQRGQNWLREQGVLLPGMKR